MSTPAAEWNDALNRYISTVRCGGTPEQRTWAWARATAALDKLIEHDVREMRRRSKTETQEIGTAA